MGERGFGTWLAIEGDPYGEAAGRIRSTAVAFVRQSPPRAMSLLETRYADAEFAASESAIAGLGYLVVDWLQMRRPQAFQDFVLASKRGAVWTRAVQSAMGIGWDQMAQSALSYYRTND